MNFRVSMAQIPVATVQKPQTFGLLVGVKALHWVKGCVRVSQYDLSCSYCIPVALPPPSPTFLLQRKCYVFYFAIYLKIDHLPCFLHSMKTKLFTEI